jgi:class 3 adenylate cyclase
MRFASPESYTPKHLAEKILASKAALEGERKLVTLLFADMKGSMEVLADRDPEEARKLLDPVLERMMDAVHRYEGTVNQVMGDGVMALFGAPLAHEDHAVRACYAALRMQESVRRYVDEVRRTVGVPIHIRVGVNSGDVVVRSIGNDLHMDYTAVGQTTHLAARMEQAAMPGSILITADALRLAEGYIQVKPLGPIPVKGLTGPMEVYEVTVSTIYRKRRFLDSEGIDAVGGRRKTASCWRGLEVKNGGAILRSISWPHRLGSPARPPQRSPGAPCADQRGIVQLGFRKDQSEDRRGRCGGRSKFLRFRESADTRGPAKCGLASKSPPPLG